MIKITIDSYSVEFNKIITSDYPRIKVNSTPIEYSVYGNPALSGSYYEPKHIWTFTALITQEQKEALELLYNDYDNKRRTFGNFNILLEDYSCPIVENTRTRQLATGSSESSIPNGVKYNASFLVGFNEVPKFSYSGSKISVSISLAETTKLSS